MGQVLYVEDIAELRDAGAAVLMADGHTVSTVAGAAEAMAFCEDQARPLSAVIIRLQCSFIGAGIDLAGRIARERPDVAVTTFSGGIRTLPVDMPATVRLLQKPMSVFQFRDAASETGESARLHHAALELRGVKRVL